MSRSQSLSRANEEHINRLCAESTPLTADEERMLFDRIAAGDATARETLILANLRLASLWAHRHAGHVVSYEDLFSEAVEAICHAVGLFDPELGKFAMYASGWIRNRFGKAIRRSGTFKLSGKARLSECATLPSVESLDDHAELLARGDDPWETPIGKAIQREESAALHEALLLLSPLQRERLTRRYELDGRSRGQMKDVLAELGISRSSFHRTETLGLQKLRWFLGGKFSFASQEHT